MFAELKEFIQYMRKTQMQLYVVMQSYRDGTISYEEYAELINKNEYSTFRILVMLFFVSITAALLLLSGAPMFIVLAFPLSIPYGFFMVSKAKTSNQLQLFIVIWGLTSFIVICIVAFISIEVFRFYD